MLRRFAMRDIAFGEKASSVSVSADGNYLMTVFRNNFSMERSRVYSTLTDLKTGKVIDSNVDPKMQWMP